MSETYKTLRCETCGGELKYSNDFKSAACLNCGNEYHFNGEKSEALIIALNTANAKRIACHFDAAAIDYKAVIGREPDDAEAHWGLVLSTYGIEYVEDPRAKNRIPTCRRTVKESILENEDYLAALNNAAPEQKEIYKEKAAIIDRLQKKIKRQLEDEEEYDVFISFKSTDEDGHPTEDRQIARRIYDELTRRGIKTFFSEVTLKSRLGEDYEPIIYKALYSCKFFILITTSEENMNSAWVKNEWARYHARVHDEALSNAGCAVFKNIKLNELPPFLRGQGIDLTKYPAGGYEVEIADGLSAHLGLTNKNEEAEEIKRQIEEQKKLQQSLEEKLKTFDLNAAKGEVSTVENLLTRGHQELEGRDINKANNFFETALSKAPKNAAAWWGKFLCECQAVNAQEIIRQINDEGIVSKIANSQSFKNAKRYASGEVKKNIDDFCLTVNNELQGKLAQLKSEKAKVENEDKEKHSIYINKESKRNEELKQKSTDLNAAEKTYSSKKQTYDYIQQSHSQYKQGLYDTSKNLTKFSPGAAAGLIIVLSIVGFIAWMIKIVSYDTGELESLMNRYGSVSFETLDQLGIERWLGWGYTYGYGAAWGQILLYGIGTGIIGGIVLIILSSLIKLPKKISVKNYKAKIGKAEKQLSKLVTEIKALEKDIIQKKTNLRNLNNDIAAYKHAESNREMKVRQTASKLSDMILVREMAIKSIAE